MGVYLHFQAIPDGGRLVRRLREDRPLRIMYCELIHHPAGPWDTDRLSHDELDELLADITNQPAFGSLPAVHQAYDDLRAELERAEREHPGLRRRSAYFKLCEFDTELARGLTAAGRTDADGLADSLVFGSEAFAPDGGGRNVSLRYVPPLQVADAAALFRGVGPEAFTWQFDDWQEFRGVYTEAAARGEGIVSA